MEADAHDIKGKLSLIKKRRDQKSFQSSSTASVLLPASLEQDPLEHRTAEEIAVPRERSTNRGAVAEEKRNMDQNSNGTTTSDQRRKKMEDLRESCNSTKNNGGGIGGFKTFNDQPSEMVVATSATRRPSKEFNQRKNDSKETAPSANSKLAIQWTCDECHHTCIPVRSESRCLW
jgi:rubrerythrin